MANQKLAVWLTGKENSSICTYFTVTLKYTLEAILTRGVEFGLKTSKQLVRKAGKVITAQPILHLYTAQF